MKRFACTLALLAPWAVGAQGFNPFETGQDDLTAIEAEFASAALEVETADEGLQIQYYGDVGAGWKQNNDPAFVLGALDIFIVSALSDRITLVSENVLEVLDSPVFDLERLYLDYSATPWFNLRLGRDHTPLGYYGQSFHHALLFQLGISRPDIVEFEDGGGALPSHTIGLTAWGTIAAGKALSIRYDFGVSNGRGTYADDILNAEDLNKHKAFIGRLSVRPLAFPGLEIGASAYLDKIEPSPTDPTNHHSVGTPIGMSETVANGFVVYRQYPIDLIAEVYWIKHGLDAEVTNADGQVINETSLMSAFVQLGVEFDAWTPYARYELIDRDEADPFFNASGTPVEETSVHGGIRYALHEKAVVKLEFERNLTEKSNSGAFQAAFGF